MTKARALEIIALLEKDSDVMWAKGDILVELRRIIEDEFFEDDTDYSFMV